MNLTSFIRYLQGERRGMGSQLKPPTHFEEDLAAQLHPQSFYAPGIMIRNDVLLADVSFWQSSIDFDKMREGLQGVIIRAGQRNWEDIRFRENWSKAKAAGIPRGSYWFYDSRETPKRQAEIWSNILSNDLGELPHAADFEESYSGSYGKREDFKSFINWFQDFTDLPDERIVNYTGYYWWLARVGNDSFFKRFQPWIAWYADMQAVRVPPPWTESDLFMWQYTSSGDGTQYGVGSLEIDLNWFCCSQENFNMRFDLITGDPTMAKNKVTIIWAQGARERSTPSINSPQVRNILPQASVHYSDVDIAPDADEPFNPDKKWIKLQSGWYIATRFPSSAGNPTRAVVEVIDQEPEPDPEPNPSGHLVEVYIDGVLEFKKELL